MAKAGKIKTMTIAGSLPGSFIFSQSSLQDFVDCPRRFQLRYLEQMSWPAVETEPLLENEKRQQNGRSFHLLVQQHLLGLGVEQLASQAASPDLASWWKNFLAAGPELVGWKLYPEKALAAPLGENRLMAKYDLIAFHPDGRATIYDWKTYHRRPRNEAMAARQQTRVYRSLLVQAGAGLQPPAGPAESGNLDPGKIEMIYWYADYPTEPARFPYRKSQFHRDWEGLTSLVQEIRTHRFFAMTEDDQKCAFCSYRSYCNRGSQAGQDELLESELEPSEINLEQIQEIAF
jgi:hypothetical protein